MNTLKEVAIGGTAKVVKLHGEGAVKRRIMDMGITKGVEVYGYGTNSRDRSYGSKSCTIR